MKLIDRYLVKIQNKHETEFKHGSLVLERPSLTERIEGTDGKTCSYNPDQHLTRYGIVVSLPHKISNTPARMVNVGHPQHSRYISSEMIIANDEDPSQYNPSTYTDQYQSHKDLYRAEALEGDLVHFYHTAIDRNDPVMPEHYAINVSNVFAYQQGNKLIMCYGFVLCEYIATRSNYG